MSNGKSALGLDGNLAAALGYPIGIIALILAIMEKENRFVKFHAFQSLFYHLLFVVIYIVYSIATTVITLVLAQISEGLALLGLLLWLLFFVILLVYFGGLIFAAVKAYGNNLFKIPVVGNFADKIANK